MKEENLSILRSLKQDIEELLPLIESAQNEIYGGNNENPQSGLDLIMSELTMTVIMLANVDSNVSDSELGLINDMRHVVYGYGIPDLVSNDYMGLYREFLLLYPKKRLTLDHIPASIRLLRTYDERHGTEYSDKSKNLFINFAEAIARADNKEGYGEDMLLGNFKDILNAT